eukprot:1158363-Pelagomonas_calceolata.AAC.6
MPGAKSLCSRPIEVELSVAAFINVISAGEGRIWLFNALNQISGNGIREQEHISISNVRKQTWDLCSLFWDAPLLLKSRTNSLLVSKDCQLNAVLCLEGLSIDASALQSEGFDKLAAGLVSFTLRPAQQHLFKPKHTTVSMLSAFPTTPPGNAQGV